MAKYVLMKDAYSYGFDCEHNCGLLLEEKNYNVILSLIEDRSKVFFEIWDSEYDDCFVEPMEANIFDLADKKYKNKYRMPTIEEFRKLYKASLKPVEAGSLIKKYIANKKEKQDGKANSTI